MTVPDLKFSNILVIHFGQMGDVVLGLPALRAIRERFDRAQITALVGKPAGDIVRMANVSDAQILVDRVALRDGNTLRSIARIARLVADVRTRNFDLVIDLNSLYETNLLGFLSGAPYRLFENRERRSLDRLARFPSRPPKEVKTRHHTDRYLAVLEPLGITDAPRTIVVAPPPESAKLARAFFAEHGIGGEDRIGLFPGAGHPSRRWPIENFVKLARQFSQKGKTVLAFLGPEEGHLRPRLQTELAGVAVLVDEMPLADVFAMFAELSVFVGGDTGPMHLAALAGTPVVLLSERGAARVYLPLIEKLRVLQDGRLADLAVEQVEAAVEELVSR